MDVEGAKARVKTKEAELLRKYGGRETLVDDEQFWTDLFDALGGGLVTISLPYSFDLKAVRSLTEEYECECCGKCCSIYEKVILQPSDIRRILKNTTQKYLQKHTFVGEDGSVYLRFNKTCPFLGDKECKVYKHRPDACFLFPFQNAVQGQQLKVRILCEPSKKLIRHALTEASQTMGFTLLPNGTLLKSNG